MTERVVVTGIGVVSPIGIGRAAFWQNLCAGRSGIAPITRFPVAEGVPCLAAEVRDFEPHDWIRSPHLRRMDWFSRMVVGAARGAVLDAGVETAGLPPEDLAVVVGTQLGDISESCQHLERLYSRGPSGVSPMIFPNLVLNSAASYVSMELGATGANLTVTQGEVSGEAAIEAGYDLIRQDRARFVLAGGGDELAAVVRDVYRRAGALAGQRGGVESSRPYDAGRNGVVSGEGVAMLLLESAAQARAAGRAAHAEIVAAESVSLSSSRYDLPLDARAAAARIRERLPVDALCDVGLIVGSANSSRRLDAFEIEVCAELAANLRSKPALLSIKGAIGEFGGAGALSIAAGCLALREQTVPLTCFGPEPAGRMIQPLRAVRPAALERVLCIGFARGGAAAAVVLGRA